MRNILLLVVCTLLNTNSYAQPYSIKPTTLDPHLVVNSFKVIPHDKTYTFTWATTKEEDSSYSFKLQYSIDKIYWELINVVVPAQRGVNGYSYTYQPTLIQNMYFRIQQEDGSNTSFFSDTIQSSLITTRAVKDSFERYVPPAESIFIELAGNSFVYSINFDSRFWKRNGGPGWRLGLGYLKLFNYEAAAVNVMLNELIGYDGHYLEMGVGFTLTSGNTNSITKQEGDFLKLFSVGNIGYRYQSTKDKGTILRIMATPFTNNFKDVKWWGGITYGQRF